MGPWLMLKAKLVLNFPTVEEGIKKIKETRISYRQRKHTCKAQNREIT